HPQSARRTRLQGGPPRSAHATHPVRHAGRAGAYRASGAERGQAPPPGRRGGDDVTAVAMVPEDGLTISGLSIVTPANVPLVEDTGFEVGRQELVILVGPSGSGKT